ncbi:MAG: pseudouridine synthase [Desulfitobacteriaceae bacterium]
MEPSSGIRLQKLLAQAGVASRRQAEEIIRAGRVNVNGKKVETLGLKVENEDRVTVDGKVVSVREAWHYYLLYKPLGVITSVNDPKGRKTVMDLLPELPVRIYPVGRLDYDTSGLLLLTNDGELAYRLTHPSYGVEKTYRVWVGDKITAQALKILREGVELEDGKTAPAKIKPLEDKGELPTLEVSIHEGRNRQVRRMFTAVGYPVLKLERIRFGPLSLDGELRPGLFRPLRLEEQKALHQAVGLDL